MQITTVNIDLAKDVFQVHGVDNRGGVVLRKSSSAATLRFFFESAALCSRHGGLRQRAPLARKLVDLRHDVRLIAPQFVKPYVKNNKIDAADAEAIYEAVSRPSMRFVPIKAVEQQSVLALYRARQGFVKAPDSAR
jgi:transposase